MNIQHQVLDAAEVVALEIVDLVAHEGVYTQQTWMYPIGACIEDAAGCANIVVHWNLLLLLDEVNSVGDNRDCHRGETV
jgi:hypothetical protein